MMGTIAFAIVAALMLISALLVVSSKNLVRAVLWLGVTLTLTAALYAMLEATFMAGVQVLLYVGGVVTLMLFGLMLTRRHEGLLVPADSGTPLRGILGAGAVFGLLASATVHSTLPQAPATEATRRRARPGDPRHPPHRLRGLVLAAARGADRRDRHCAPP
jgi:NADH-quinone oxidoreductase subunit J